MLQYLYAFYLASVDAIVLSLLKAKSVGRLTGAWMLPFSALVYAIQPLVFYNALSFESMTIMNILWDVMSDVVVTLVGVLVFGESLNAIQYAGIALSLIGITLLGYKNETKAL